MKWQPIQDGGGSINPWRVLFKIIGCVAQL